MRRFVAVLTLVALSGCECSREVGGREVDCIGAFDDADPGYRYKVSIRNVAFTILGSTTIAIPIVWLVSCVRCPTARVEASK